MRSIPARGRRQRSPHGAAPPPVLAPATPRISHLRRASSPCASPQARATHRRRREQLLLRGTLPYECTLHATQPPPEPPPRVVSTPPPGGFLFFCEAFRVGQH